LAEVARATPFDQHGTDLSQTSTMDLTLVLALFRIEPNLPLPNMCCRIVSILSFIDDQRRRLEPALRYSECPVRGYLISRNCHLLIFGLLATKRALERGQLRFDIPFQLAALDDVLAIAAEEIIDRLNPDTDRPRRLVLIKSLNEKYGVPDCSMMPSITP
jgi:hypothetical protein